MTSDVVGALEPDLSARSQTEELLWRILHEVVAFYIDLSGERHLASASRRVLGVILRLKLLYLPLRVVGDHDLERPEHDHCSQSPLVEVLAQAVLQESIVDHAVGFGDSNSFAKRPDRLRSVTPPSQAAQSRHARIVPSAHIAVFNKPPESSLASQSIGEIEAGKLNLLWWLWDLKHLKQPIIKRPMLLKLECA